MTERLPRTVGLFSAVAVIVGTTIGSGIFRVPAKVAALVGEPGPVLLAWVIGGVLALFGALTVAELAAASPRSGGLFAYIDEAFGPMPAFLFGWSQLSVIRASALGSIATIFAEYLGYFTKFTPQEVRYAAAATILVVALINYLGVKHASRVMGVATIAKYAGMVGLWFSPLRWGTGTGAIFRTRGLRRRRPSVSRWSLRRWSRSCGPTTGGPICRISAVRSRIPGRNFPLALIGGTFLIIAIYLLLNAAYIYLVPVSEMAGQPLIAATAAARIPLLGGAGAGIVSAIVMISCFGTLNGSMLTNPRIFFAMADRGLFFKEVARVSPKFQTPSVAIWLAAVLGCVYVMFNDFQQLADRFVLGIWPFYILAILGVFVMRRKRPDLERPYRTIGYPVVPIVFLLAATGMVLNALVTDPINTGRNVPDSRGRCPTVLSDAGSAAVLAALLA